MEEAFWQARWAQGQIGFHLQEVNPYLQQHWPSLSIAPGSQVLVPLCGKSLDMAWLAGQGLRVLGVELAERAVEDFFAEQGLQPEVEQQGVLRLYRAAGVEIYCGDFFNVQAEHVAGCTALYDRAALIALPETMRARYVEHLAAILPGNCRGLLVSLEYAQEEMSGPPFSVSQAEIDARLSPYWQIELLARHDVLNENWRFLQRGLSSLHESIYRLQRG
ncbi:MAG: thiopurine S-methyltransferase [Pseudomonas sp.]|uniref:Thiopurine S-methyltransferase n=1 Tax=Pseudomonas fluvialis TaxID=1793966 RepID=A0A2I0CTT1_9PSED|nr:MULTISPECIES: thiopurine S-methyltransferase [Pseudomonas]MBP7824067.1 thiopurine S-methyltransferase [Pseudomonas sp.]MBP8237878.1 thiopurine S-methyltransferase [Pseudomonas sp.]OXM41282.1 thiopurine S-methyltransferase [Pseudomonas fluvialis]PKF72744.1 thiopurine S-methyltransferase [Pseudomonas pharmacofabricae]GGH95154.1 thiopurine S-methyltransferase [Pseudomonas fluvialis]